MPFDFAAAKSQVRRTVNATFGVQAFYSDDSVNPPVETRARFHTRLSKPFGDLVDGAGYAQTTEGIDRIVLIPEDIDGNPITLKRGGEFTFPETLPGDTYTLELREPATGPLEEAWSVTKK